MLVVYEALSHQNHAREQNVSRHDVVGDEQQGHNSEGPHSAWISGSGHLALPRTASNHRRVFPRSIRPVGMLTLISLLVTWWQVSLSRVIGVNRHFVSFGRKWCVPV